MYIYSSSSLSSVFLLTFFVFLDFLGVSSTSSSFPSSAFLFHFFFSGPESSFQASTPFFESSLLASSKPFSLVKSSNPLPHGSTLPCSSSERAFHFFPTSGNILRLLPRVLFDLRHFFIDLFLGHLPKEAYILKEVVTSWNRLILLSYPSFGAANSTVSSGL